MNALRSTMTQRIAFNTGAHYTTHGQRIAAWVEKTDTGHADAACFVDFDRHIYEHFPFRSSGQFASPADFARHVMHMYDMGQYPLSHVEGLRSRLSDVHSNGYDAFISNPEVCVIARLELARR